MSVPSHQAGGHHWGGPHRPVKVWVIVVSSTRTVDTDTSGSEIGRMLEAAGHQMLDRTIVDDDVAQISTLLRGLSVDGVTEVVVLTGGTGLSRRDVTPEAVEALFDRPILGFGELFRMLSYAEIGPAAMLSRATAGMMGSLLVFALPGSTAACRLGMERLVLPELTHLVRELAKEPAPLLPPVPRAAPAKDLLPKVAVGDPLGGESMPGELASGETAAPSPVRGISVSAALDAAPTGQMPASPVGQLLGAWQRAAQSMGGEVTRGGWVEIPEAIEKIAPVVDVLHKAGERGTLKVPSGRSYALFGFPDLHHPASKVLAIASGSPFAEILALHRHPVPTGTCIDEGFGVVSRRTEPVAAAAESVTGRPLKDTSGRLFAVQGGAVFIERAGRAVRFDGQRERDEGTVKQALAFLVLDWASR